ncbi:glycosyltransferase family 2 protein [Burkholderia multivorans]|uniref:glycosyltransferase family 2 protein n=1 Tax=Burkholderia multivorans TaxID=87883 RepID=UPI001FC80BD4|nr:glycosyltransferase family 2 protein [Burkholderia multivorans]
MIKTGSEEVAAQIIHRGNLHATVAWLVEGQVAGNAKACVATVVLTMHDGRTQALNVLISNKGRIQELVRTPASVRAVHLTAGRDENPLRVLSLRHRRLTSAEFRLRQFWRAASTLRKQPLQRCARAGLTPITLFRNLDYAYEVACRFRANVYREGYAGWYQEFYAITPTDRALMIRRAKSWQYVPVFKIFLLVNKQTTPAEIDATRAALQAQTYQRFEVELLDDLSGDWGRLIPAVPARDSWHLVIRAGVTLAEQALFCLADAVIKTPDAAVIYADHDVVGADGQLSDPVFKPDWSPELLRSTNYIGDAFVWNGRYAGRLPEFGADATDANAMHALLLALSELGSPMVHVPAPLWHMTPRSEERGDGAETVRAVAAHLRRVGVPAEVESTGPGRCRVRYPVAEPAPLVSIIIPTRDQLGHLRRCISSVLEKTRYGPYEIIVVDNQSAEPDTLAYLQSLQQLANVRVLPFDEPFNYSRINNMAVAEAKGELVCLLNNDTEVISPDWLREMVGLLLSDGVAVVGAKLLYGDDTVQHAGDTVGPGGCANHLHSGIGRDEPGYTGRALVAQDLSAVTAACLLTRRSTYQTVGGLDETHLKVAFNDVDYCLRVRDAGLRVVWTPHAKLYHHESVSRGKDETPAQRRRFKAEVSHMRKRWAHLMYHDPYYNPNLNYLQPDFSLAATPDIRRPWSGRNRLSAL